ncbi:hypothetical protein [Nonomuraea bangladeshensis]|uniref:hypothetical protein n=1 Tax=Nonomuraea bangladeshensis TaxID=404385 RepID=UPI003C2B4890
MKGKTGSGESERQLINHVIHVIQERLDAARGLGPTSFHNSDFIRRRWDELVNDLELAHRTIAELTEQLYGAESNPVPDALRCALRRRGGGLRPVRLTVGGTARVIMVKPQGRKDPAAEARLWANIQERYGRGESAK